MGIYEVVAYANLGRLVPGIRDSAGGYVKVRYTKLNPFAEYVRFYLIDDYGNVYLRSDDIGVGNIDLGSTVDIDVNMYLADVRYVTVPMIYTLSVPPSSYKNITLSRGAKYLVYASGRDGGWIGLYMGQTRISKYLKDIDGDGVASAAFLVVQEGIEYTLTIATGANVNARVFTVFDPLNRINPFTAYFAVAEYPTPGILSGISDVMLLFAIAYGAAPIVTLSIYETVVSAAAGVSAPTTSATMLMYNNMAYANVLTGKTGVSISNVFI